MRTIDSYQCLLWMAGIIFSHNTTDNDNVFIYLFISSDSLCYLPAGIAGRRCRNTLAGTDVVAVRPCLESSRRNTSLGISETIGHEHMTFILEKK